MQPILSASSRRGVSGQLLGELRSRRADLHAQLLQPPGHADRPSLVAEVTLDLPDDCRCGVGGELQASLDLEAVHGLDQPDGADLDEVLEGLPTVAEPAGAVLDERQVQVRQLVPGPGPINVGPRVPTQDVEELSTAGAHPFENRRRVCRSGRHRW